MSVEGVSSSNPTENVGASEMGGSNPHASHSGKTLSPNIAKWREEEPELYEKMLMALATNIANDMKKKQDRLSKMMKEGRQQG